MGKHVEDPATIVSRCAAEGVTLREFYRHPTLPSFGWMVGTACPSTYAMWWNEYDGFAVRKINKRGRTTAKGRKLETVLPELQRIIRWQ